MSFELPKLPYALNDLEPYISARTLEFHYGKHHATYVNNLNAAIKNTDLGSQNLEEIILMTAGIPDKTGIFNNAAQAWNHNFYWECLTHNGGGAVPDSDFKSAVLASFGSEEKFKEDLKVAALSQFGSGWAWVVAQDGAVKIAKTSNADTPFAHKQIPLFTIDVWEHSYYLDYQNRRADYIQAIIDHLANWHFAATVFSKI